MRSGMTSLEHVLEVAMAGTGGAEHADRLPEVAAQVAASGIAVGTLAAANTVSNRIKLDREAFLRREGAGIRAVVGDSGVAAVEAMDMAQWDIVPDELVRKVVYAFHTAGVRLVLGTDSHHPAFLAGSSGLDEIEFLVESGLSPFAALRAATYDAAAVIGLGAEIGSITAGKRADLLLVAANPLLDPSSLRRANGVMTAGRWLGRSDLDLLMQAAILEGAW